MSYLKAELYRLRYSKLIITSLIAIILYTLFGNYVYAVNAYPINELYNHFGEEYLLIFFILSLAFTIFLYNEDINHKLFYEYKRPYMFIIRFIFWLIFIIFLFIITFISSYIISLLGNMKVVLSFKILVNLIKIVPLLLVYNLVMLLGLFTIKKASYSLMLAFGLYTFISYIESVLNIKTSFLKYLVIFNLNFNNLYLKWYLALIIFLITFIGLYILLNYLYKKMN